MLHDKLCHRTHLTAKLPMYKFLYCISLKLQDFFFWQITVFKCVLSGLWYTPKGVWVITNYWYAVTHVTHFSVLTFIEFNRQENNVGLVFSRGGVEETWKDKGGSYLFFTGFLVYRLMFDLEHQNPLQL